MPGRQSENLAGLAEIDIRHAHAARVYDYLLGGQNNFAVDRDAAERGAAPQGGLDYARRSVRANREFLGRITRHLAGDLGVRQFLDIGTGIPHDDNVHGVAQDVAPDARIVYVDNDPVVLAHAHKLLQSTEEGATDYLWADLREPEKILAQAAQTLNLAEPVALMLVEILHLIPQEEDPYGIVAHLLETVPSGSYLVVSHLTDRFQPEETRAMAERYNECASQPFTLRSRDEITGFFDGLKLLDPGVVRVDAWYPPGEPAPPLPADWTPPVYCGVGHKTW